MNFTKEQIEKAMTCKSAEELLAMVKAEGLEMTAEEAEKYFAQLSNQTLNLDEIDAVSGGGCDADAAAGRAGAAC